MFGKKFEKIIADFDLYQPELPGFECAENKKPEEKQLIPAHQRVKTNRKGQDKITLPDDLPIE